MKVEFNSKKHLKNKNLLFFELKNKVFWVLFNV